MAKDAVLAYHTALEFHGKAYTLYNRIIYVSNRKPLPFKFQTHEIKEVLAPKPLRVKDQKMFGVICLKRSGVVLKVTNLERTFVDVLDRTGLAGSWEEIWGSLESIELFNLDQVLYYILLLENCTTDIKAGFLREGLPYRDSPEKHVGGK